MNVRGGSSFLFLATAISLTVLVGCGESAETGRPVADDPAPETSRSSEAAAITTDEMGGSKGSGLLTMGGTGYPFVVETCLLMGDLTNTVTGHGDAGGEPYEVVIMLTNRGTPQALEAVNLTFASGRKLVGAVSPNFMGSDGSHIEKSDRTVRSTRPIALRSEIGGDAFEATVEVDCS